MPEEYLPKDSSTLPLTVGYPPFGEIVYFRVPAAARNGEPVGTSTMVKNTGDLHGDFYISLWDASTGAKLFQSGKVGIGSGAQADFSFTGADGPTMPDRDLELIVQTHHDGAYDDLQQQRVPLLVEIATALSINIEPSTVAIGGSYTHSGRLTRADTGAGLAGEVIILHRNGVMLPDLPTTDGAGNYSLTITAPTEKGTYTCQSKFLGSLHLEASDSKEVGLGVGVVAVPSLAVILTSAFALAGLAAVIYATRK